ncbi:hypothetical protein KSF78_0002754 [Schistosoma japonicum]|nr:hypothetical protein KSF78_0002754 [Schistosoma japonicum]
MVRYNAIYRKQNRMIYLHELLFESTNSSLNRACCIVAVTMYYEHIKYARRLDSSGWLLTAILASFQLCLFVFMFIFF